LTGFSIADIIRGAKGKPTYLKKESKMTYKEMYLAFQEGQITPQEWYELCLAILTEKMVENKDVFLRLKNCT